MLVDPADRTNGVHGMGDQRRALPAWTTDQIVGVTIGSAVVLVGLVLFMGLAATTTGDDPDLLAKMYACLALAGVGLIPLGVSLYSRWSSVRWWRSHRR